MSCSAERNFTVGPTRSGSATGLARQECVGCPYATRESKTHIVAAFDRRLVINLRLGSVMIDGRRLSMRRAQTRAAILAALAQNVDDVVEHDKLIMAMEPGDDVEDAMNLLCTHIVHLRRMFSGTDFEIETVWNRGYMLRLRSPAMP